MRIRTALLSLALGCAIGAAHAQAPSPADVGIVHGAPDVFKLKGSDNVWTPFGSVDPSTHIFAPGTNGPIAPNDCIKWGPGLTSAGAACNSVTGGATPANQLTIYTSHSGLVNNVTTPTEAWTVLQQGFYAPGDGGGATYQWNLTSTCAADGINCVLPLGQSSGTPGRYLLQIAGTLNVRQIGMQSGGADNSPYLATLMSALGPSGFNNGSFDVLFPPDNGKTWTAYYFSQSFIISRIARFRCGDGVKATGVELVFPAGVTGVIQEDGHFTSDNQYGGGTVDGCTIISLGSGVSVTTAGATALTITGGMATDPGDVIPATTWHVGDGILATPLSASGGAIPAVQPGAYVTNVTGPALNPVLTLASGYMITSDLTSAGVEVHQLPASLKFTVQTTTGSNAITVTAGPRPLVPGDIIWSDAFPIGTTVENTSSNSFPQTVNMVGPFNNVLAQNATVTHTSGSPGQLWVTPAGLKRDVQANSSGNFISNWPIGLEMSCSGAGNILCTGSHDEDNFYRYDLVGRWVGGNNTSASSSTNEEMADNFWADVMEGGNLGEVYINLNPNSWETPGSTANALLGNCTNNNWSVFFGGYIIGGAAGGCADPHTLFPVTGGNPSWLMIGNQTQGIVPPGTPSILAGEFAGQWEFLKNGYTGDPCVGMHVVVYVLAISHSGCANGGTMGVFWDAPRGVWSWGQEGGSNRILNQFGDDYLGYIPADLGGGIVPIALELGNPSQENTGQERVLDGGFSPPTAPRLLGDTRLYHTPTPGNITAWTNTKIGQAALAADVTAGTTTSVAVSGCPAGLPANVEVIAQYNINAPPIVLDQVLGTLASCVGTTLTLNAASPYNSANGTTIQFVQWLPSGHAANDAAGTSWPVATVTNIGGLATCGATTVGFGVVNNGVAVGTGGYGTAVSATGSSTRPVFCDGTSWTYH